jgi:hypothetical protein
MAVFRLGIAEAKRSPEIAKSLVVQGREPARAALRSILEPARELGLVTGDIEKMNGHFHGLLWGGSMVWMLLGVEPSPGPKEIERRASDAASSLIACYGTENNR